MSGGGIKHLAKGSRCPPLQRGKLRLYSMRFCPYAQRVHLVLDSKKVPHDVVYVNLSEKPEWLQEKSPLGKVPALEVTEGDCLYESLVISEYLDERYPQRPLQAADPLQRAKDKLLVERFNDVVTAMYKVFRTSDSSAFKSILSGLDLFETELDVRRTPFFGGAEPGMLDYMVWPWCERADMLQVMGGDRFQLDKVRFKKLLEWRVGMTNDSAVQLSILEPLVHAKYLQSRRDGHPDYDMPLIHRGFTFPDYVSEEDLCKYLL